MKLETSSGELKTLYASYDLSFWFAMFVTPDEEVFVLTMLSTIFRLSPEGNLTIVAGSKTAGYGGDGGPAVLATFNK